MSRGRLAHKSDRVIPQWALSVGLKYSKKYLCWGLSFLAENLPIFAVNVIISESH